MKIVFGIVLIAALVFGGSSAYRRFTSTPQQQAFRTATVTRGDLLITVNATGTLEPEEVVDVGAQVLGRIKELGIDPRGRVDERFKDKHVDYGTEVEQGMLLAQIDPAIYSAQYDQAKAAVDNARANVLQLEAKTMQAEAEWNRAQRLRALKLTSVNPATFLSDSKTAEAQPLPIKGISDADYILAQANYEVAKANIEVGKAQVAQAAATLKQAETNLNYTSIYSPVSGTIIDRRVNIGQTVVSAMNAPSLFLIARDLRRMQVWASVNEADVGRLKVDMPVRFTVDTFPDDVFRGKVTQIRLNASMTQNVVTFTVVISADNPDLKLLPYLTADVDFEIQKHENVLLVPNAALRFKPRADQIVDHGDASESANVSPDADAANSADDSYGTAWVETASVGLLEPVSVRIGPTDGAMTIVESGHLHERSEVVLGERRAEQAAEASNPFGPPKIPKSKSKKSGE